ncbi:PLAT domain-containing protein 3 [Elaeis guineensis]|uniref:PLAT domain-containing protein 3 n=1 Tax=Elaeis guineensis var. tenera TaxID=51953 RepID=A0A6I9S5I4_ELAGV|nr:PLAT domain-containing protein 3 [Elaeis guineensis]
MMKGTKKAIFLFLLLSSLVIISHCVTPLTIKPVNRDDDEYQCVYTVYIRTGSIWKGGTDSVISLVLAGSDGWGVAITDIESWGGIMEAGHNYFERGNLDIFSGRGPCLSTPPCWMNLTSDGSGSHHGWYCNYVEVTTTGPHMGCAQQLFTVEQWLATDAAPYQLYATRDSCTGRGNAEEEPKIGDRIGRHVTHVA